MKHWQRVYGDLRYLQKERQRLAKRYDRNPNLTLETAMLATDELISEKLEYLRERRQR